MSASTLKTEQATCFKSLLSTCIKCCYIVLKIQYKCSLGIMTDSNRDSNVEENVAMLHDNPPKLIEFFYQMMTSLSLCFTVIV